MKAYFKRWLYFCAVAWAALLTLGAIVGLILAVGKLVMLAHDWGGYTAGAAVVLLLAPIVISAFCAADYYEG